MRCGMAPAESRRSKSEGGSPSSHPRITLVASARDRTRTDR
jgi:hypothetical protein